MLIDHLPRILLLFAAFPLINIKRVGIKLRNCYWNGGSRKYPYPYHGRHLGIPMGGGVTSTGIPRIWGGSLDWNSEDMGGSSGQ